MSEEDPREHLNIVIIGHVDSGKSTSAGRLLILMGMIDKRNITKYGEARNLLDTDEEEVRKGITVDVGRAHFETENRRFTILDAPEHRNYVPNMIHGTSQADVAILVISARKGEFETGFERGGQTREHAMLAKTLGVDKLIVVINNMDEASWSHERYDECVSKLRPYLRMCRFAVMRDVAFIPVSGLHGDNVKIVNKSWYEVDSLIDFMDKMHISNRNPDGPLRIPVQSRYTERGICELGKVESGILKTGQNVVLMPTNTSTVVNEVYINDLAVRTAKPGENVTIRLSCGIDDIQKGFVICSAENLPRSVYSFTAQIALVDTLEHRPLLTVGSAIVSRKVLAVLTAYLIKYFPELKALSPSAPIVMRVEECLDAAGIARADMLAWSAALNTSPPRHDKQDSENEDKSRECKGCHHSAAINELIVTNKSMAARRTILEAALLKPTRKHAVDEEQEQQQAQSDQEAKPKRRKKNR